MSSLYIAYVGLHAYLCVYYGLLYLRRTSRSDLLCFGLLSGALGIYNVGSALLASASTLEQSVQAETLQLSVLPCAVALYVHFVVLITKARGRRVVILAYAAALCFLAISAFAPLIDSTHPHLRTTSGVLRGTPTALALVEMGLLLGFAAYAVFRLARSPRVAFARLLIVATGANFLIGAHDMLSAWIDNSPLLEHSLTVWYVVVSDLMVRDMLRASDDLESRTNELHRLVDDLRKTQAELSRKESLATVGELSAVIAHEVRNPLAIIKNAISGLRRSQTEERDREMLLAIVDEETDRLNRLVKDLLSFARPIEVQRRSISLDDLLRRALETARAGIGRPLEIDASVEVDSEAATTNGDPDLLRQAFVNVIENALQAMPTGGTLLVRSRVAGMNGHSAVAIEISDTGEGMDSLVRQKALAPFFTTRPAGTGLGLAIVERLVRAHGGSLSLESSHGRGTTVTITLPMRSATAPPTQAPSASGAG